MKPREARRSPQDFGAIVFSQIDKIGAERVGDNLVKPLLVDKSAVN
jgi:hypothetical protein